MGFLRLCGLDPDARGRRQGPTTKAREAACSGAVGYTGRMGYMPIERVRIQNYGCIKDVELNLERLSAFIGPNDSGKSTALRAIRTAAQLGAGVLIRDAPGAFDPMLEPFTEGMRISLLFSDGFEYAIWVTKGQLYEGVLKGGNLVPGQSAPPRSLDQQGALHGMGLRGQELLSRIQVPTMVRFDPDELRRPGELIPESRGIGFATERGAGLASVFDAITNRDAEAFTKIQSETRKLFPRVAKLGLINVDSYRKELAITLADGTRVGAAGMSEGLLYFLGFAALQHIGHSRLFLVEEPENGLHPSRIAEVMTVLKSIAQNNQVVIATHSPVVLNELNGDQVNVLTRDEGGTRAILIKDTPNFAERASVYALGELWVSYSNGSDESPLLSGGARS